MSTTDLKKQYLNELGIPMTRKAALSALRRLGKERYSREHRHMLNVLTGKTARVSQQVYERILSITPMSAYDQLERIMLTRWRPGPSASPRSAHARLLDRACYMYRRDGFTRKALAKEAGVHVNSLRALVDGGLPFRKSHALLTAAADLAFDLELDDLSAGFDACARELRGVPFDRGAIAQAEDLLLGESRFVQLPAAMYEPKNAWYLRVLDHMEASHA